MVSDRSYFRFNFKSNTESKNEIEHILMHVRLTYQDDIRTVQRQTQPVADVLYTYKQVSSISFRVVCSIPTMPGKTLTQQL